MQVGFQGDLMYVQSVCKLLLLSEAFSAKSFLILCRIKAMHVCWFWRVWNARGEFYLIRKYTHTDYQEHYYNRRRLGLIIIIISTYNFCNPSWAPSTRNFHTSITIQFYSCACLTVYLDCVQTGATALHAAAREGHLRVVEMLLEANADVSIKTNVRHLTVCTWSM